ncbi:hypothetical protein ACTPOK_20085 [Streptomyces inhibens]|uniref:hypothetical protein n=1 Tax=Streptomyces inhibens TaxID=2293571 RepID=UPI00402AFAFC
MELPTLQLSGTTALYAAAGALLTVWVVWRSLRKLRGSGKRGTPAVWVAAVAAIACTAYSADTSWRFAADYLDMGGTAERAAMFGAAELALFATAFMARQNLYGPNKAPGVPGVLVWVITGVQIIPAYAESGAVGGTVRAFVGPVMAAMLWHLAMGIELRHHKPDAESHGLAAVLGRELRERLLSRLGIAERNRDAAQITRDRATVRAVALAAHLAERTPEQRGKRRGRRLARRLSVAVARASVGVDRTQRRQLLDQLAARRHAADLATIDLQSPWREFTPDPAASALAAQARDQMRQATEAIRHQGPGLFSPGQTVNTEGCSPEHPSGPRPDDAHAGEGFPSEYLDTEQARAVIEDGWSKGLTVRETAERATRAPSFVHGVFVKLDNKRGPRPVPGQLTLVNGSGDQESDRPDAPNA